MVAVATFGDVHLNVILNTILLTTDLLYTELVGNETWLAGPGVNVDASHPVLRAKPHTIKHQEGFNPELGTIDIESVPAEKLKYVEQAETALEEVQFLLSQPGWKDVKSGKGGVFIKSLFFPKYGKNVMMLEGPLNIAPEELLAEFWLNGDKTPEWNTDITESYVIETIVENMKVGYKVSGAIGGGAIASRDFLVLSLRKKIGDSYFVTYISTDHDEDPKDEEFVRAINGPSGFIMSPIYDNEGNLKTKFQWILNIDMQLPAMLPAAIVDKMLPISMTKYYKELSEHLADITSQNNSEE